MAEIRHYNLVERRCTLPGWEDCWAKFRDDVLVDEIEILDRAADFEVIKAILADYVEKWHMRDAKNPKKFLPEPFKKPEVFGRVPIKILLWCSVALTEAALMGPQSKEEDALSRSSSGKPSSAETSAGPPANSEDK